SAGPAAANAAISSSRSNSFGTSLGTADAPVDLETEDTIKEEDEGEDDGVEQVSRGIGVMKVDNGRAIFASDAHWYAILSDIAEVKNYFSDHKKQYEDQLRKVKATRDNEDNPGTSILFRGTRPVDRGEVLASFPTKHVTDKLVERYFNCYDPAVLRPTLGEPKDAEIGVLILTGVIVRLAMRMGYHKDSKPYPNVSVFQGEMRRRVWTFVRQADLLFSFQFGLPSMVRGDGCDTGLPRSLWDDELYEDMKTLPPSRPTSEPTPVSYMIAKGRLVFTFGDIVQRVQSLTYPPTYDEIMKLDNALRESRLVIPPHLQMRPVHETPTDTPTLITQRFGLELLYLKSQCVLHRKFVTPGRDTERYAYSRRTCLDASMQMLEHQATLHHEARPGGRLSSVKWFISSLTTHDFLLAAMIICLDLYQSAEAERTGRKPGASSDFYLLSEDRRRSMFQALEHCISIWQGLSDQSFEAYRACTILKVMLEKIKTHQALRPQPQRHNPSGFGVFPNGNVSDIDANVPPEHSAAMTLGMLSSGGLTPNAGGMFQSPERGYPAGMAGLLNEMPVSAERTGLTPLYEQAGGASPFSQLFAMNGFQATDTSGAGIDWDAWDSYVQGTSVDPNNLMWPMHMDQQFDPSQPQQPPYGSGFSGAAAFIGVNTPSAGHGI
ncbi:hypothetical protein B0A49_06540, partial [Cryomyces minteri]